MRSSIGLFVWICCQAPLAMPLDVQLSPQWGAEQIVRRGKSSSDVSLILGGAPSLGNDGKTRAVQAYGAHVYPLD